MKVCALSECNVEVKRRDVKHCSHQHARWAREPTRRYPPKTCTQCSAEFHKRPKEDRERWANREVCSLRCENTRRASLRWGPPESKECTRCGDTFYRRKGERSKRWERREFCSWECRHPDTGKPKSSSSQRDSEQWDSDPPPPEPEPAPPPALEPEPSEFREVKVWRPESWGGPKVVRTAS